MSNSAKPASMEHWDVPRNEVVVLHPKRHRYAVIVPVWNEGERFERQLAAMRPSAELCDIVVADAPSTDGSTELTKLSRAAVHARVSLTEPGGLSSSLRAALAYALSAGFEGTVWLDGNGKDDTACLVHFVSELDRGADYVQGSRFIPGGRGVNTPRQRELLIRLVHAPIYSLACGRWFTDSTVGFRAFSRRLLLHERVRPFRSVFRYYDLYFYLGWAACRYGLRVVDVPVTRTYPAAGPIPTKITDFRAYWRMLKPLIMLLLRRY